MPTERFYNLPDEKRQRIVKAAVMELSSVSFDELSINRIIKYAQIPRGSFYEYFEDKFDLVNYLLEDLKTQMQESAKKCLAENGGDIFDLFQKVFLVILDVGFKPENIQFYKNVFSCLRYIEYNNFDFLFTQRQLLIKQYYHLFNYEEFNVKTSDDFMCMVEMLADAFKNEVSVAFSDPDHKEQHIRKFMKKISIIKTGMMKEKIKEKVHG